MSTMAVHEAGQKQKSGTPSRSFPWTAEAHAQKPPSTAFPSSTSAGNWMRRRAADTHTGTRRRPATQTTPQPNDLNISHRFALQMDKPLLWSACLCFHRLTGWNLNTRMVLLKVMARASVVVLHTKPLFAMMVPYVCISSNQLFHFCSSSLLMCLGKGTENSARAWPSTLTLVS